MTYAVDGVEYLAVLAGAAPNTAQIQADPWLQYAVALDAMFVFALPESN